MRTLNRFMMIAAVPLMTACAGEEISRAEFGDRWPFMVDAGTLHCDLPNRVTFKTDGVAYGVNGAAVAYGFPPINPIWRNDPSIPGAKVNVGPLIERGLKICG